MDDDDPWGLAHVCPLCGSAYGSLWAAEECARECRIAERDARRAARGRISR